VVGDDPGTAYATARHAARAAFDEPGVLEKMAPMIAIAAVDQLTHGWDLAVATGQDTDLDPGLMQACREVIEPQVAAFRAAGALGDEQPVPPDATDQQRFLAMLGRKG